jgi:hypothetical protein
MLSHSAFKKKLKILEAGKKTQYWSLPRSKALTLTAQVGGSLSPDDACRQNTQILSKTKIY